jgi:hypothetical protein
MWNQLGNDDTQYKNMKSNYCSTLFGVWGSRLDEVLGIWYFFGTIDV